MGAWGIVAPICSWENGESMGEGSSFLLSLLWSADIPPLATLCRMKASAILMLGEHSGAVTLAAF